MREMRVPGIGRRICRQPAILQPADDFLVRLMLTLRQIEVIRAIMVTGAVGGAARLLNVSSPGVSRLMKHAETLVGVKLFSRRGGRYSPTPQANAIFSQINGVYDKVEDLQFVISRIKRGANTELKIGSVPSIANVRDCRPAQSAPQSADRN